MPTDFCSFSVKLFREEKKKDPERRARGEAEVDEMGGNSGSRVAGHPGGGRGAARLSSSSPTPPHPHQACRPLPQALLSQDWPLSSPPGASLLISWRKRQTDPLGQPHLRLSFHLRTRAKSPCPCRSGDSSQAKESQTPSAKPCQPFPKRWVPLPHAPCTLNPQWHHFVHLLILLC